jgi:hypothetical protein
MTCSVAPRKVVRGLVLGLVLGPASLALVACGSDDEAQAVAALKSQILSNNAMQSATTISDEQASCIARGAVEEISVEQLQDYEILDDDLAVDKKLNEVPLSERDADRLASVYLECSDAERIFEDRLLQRLAPDRPKARARVETCVRDAVTAESVRAILSQSFQKTEASAYASLSEELGDCR